MRVTPAMEAAAAAAGPAYQWVPCTHCGRALLTRNVGRSCAFTPDCPGRHGKPTKKKATTR